MFALRWKKTPQNKSESLNESDFWGANESNKIKTLICPRLEIQNPDIRRYVDADIQA